MCYVNKLSSSDGHIYDYRDAGGIRPCLGVKHNEKAPHREVGVTTGARAQDSYQCRQLIIEGVVENNLSSTG